MEGKWPSDSTSVGIPDHDIPKHIQWVGTGVGLQIRTIFYATTTPIVVSNAVSNFGPRKILMGNISTVFHIYGSNMSCTNSIRPSFTRTMLFSICVMRSLLGIESPVITDEFTFYIKAIRRSFVVPEASVCTRSEAYLSA